MDQWMIFEIHRRREDLHALAQRIRAIREIEGGRSSRLRGRLADGADSLSGALASFARAMRENAS